MVRSTGPLECSRVPFAQSALASVRPKKKTREIAMGTLTRIKALFDDDFAFQCVRVCARVRAYTCARAMHHVC